MIRKSLIALSAATVMTLGLAPAANAKTHINLNFNVGLGDVGLGFCHYEYVPYKKWNYWHTFYTIKYKKVLVC